MRSAILKSLAVLILLVGGVAGVVMSWLQAVGHCAVAVASTTAAAAPSTPACRALTLDSLIFVFKNHGHVWMPLAGIAVILLAFMLAYVLMSEPGKVLRGLLVVQAVAALSFVVITLGAFGQRSADAASFVVMGLIPLVACGIPVVAVRRRDDRWLWMLPLEAAIVALCVGTTVYMLQAAGH